MSSKSSMTFSKEGIRHNRRLEFLKLQKEKDDEEGGTTTNSNNNNNNSSRSVQQQLATSRGASTQSSMDLLTRKSKNALSKVMARANSTRTCNCCDREFASMTELRHHLSGATIPSLGVKNHIEWLEGLDADDDDDYYAALEAQKQQQRSRRILERRQSAIAHGRRKTKTNTTTTTTTNNNANPMSSSSTGVINFETSLDGVHFQSSRRVSNSFGEFMSEEDDMNARSNNSNSQNNNNNSSPFSNFGKSTKPGRSFMQTTASSDQKKVQHQQSARNNNAPNSKSQKNLHASFVGTTIGDDDYYFSEGSSILKSISSDRRSKSIISGSSGAKADHHHQQGLHSIRISSVPLVNSVIESTFNKICEYGNPNYNYQNSSNSSPSSQQHQQQASSSPGDKQQPQHSTSSSSSSFCTFHAMYKYLISTATNVRMWQMLSSKTTELRSEFAHHCSVRGGEDRSRQQTRDKLKARKQLQIVSTSSGGSGGNDGGGSPSHHHRHNNSSSNAGTITRDTSSSSQQPQRKQSSSNNNDDDHQEDDNNKHNLENDGNNIILSDAHYMTLAQFKQFLIRSPTAALFTAYQKAALQYSSMSTHHHNNDSSKSGKNTTSRSGKGGGASNNYGNNNNSSSSSPFPGGIDEINNLPYSYFASSDFEEKLQRQNKNRTKDELESVANEILAQPIQKIRRPNFSALERLGHQSLSEDNHHNNTGVGGGNTSSTSSPSSTTNQNGMMNDDAQEEQSFRHRKLNVTTMADFELKNERDAVLNRVVKHARKIKDRLV